MRLPGFVGILLFAAVFSGVAIAADEAKSAPKNIPDFDVQGISMTECQCTAYGCPCRSNGHPDHGSCDAADFTYIKHGHYGKVDMSGFKAVLVGDLIDPDASKVHGTAYFDKSDTAEQQKAFNELQLPLYVVLEPGVDGKINVLGRYDEGRINNEAAFAEFLRDPK